MSTPTMEDLRNKITPKKDDTAMETDDADQEDEVKLILHLKKSGATELGTPFRKISVAKVKEAAELNISQLRLDNEDLSDGNLSDSLVVEEYPHNANRRTEKIIEKMGQEHMPCELDISEDVNNLLNVSAD